MNEKTNPFVHKVCSWYVHGLTEIGNQVLTLWLLFEEEVEGESCWFDVCGVIFFFGDTAATGIPNNAAPKMSPKKEK